MKVLSDQLPAVISARSNLGVGLSQSSDIVSQILTRLDGPITKAVAEYFASQDELSATRVSSFDSQSATRDFSSFGPTLSSKVREKILLVIYLNICGFEPRHISMISPLFKLGSELFLI